MSTKVRSAYSVQWCRLTSGERLPFLIRGETGLPIEAPTFWSLALLRASNLQANTLKNRLRSLIFLYVWADLRGVNLQRRLVDGIFFSLGEILDMISVTGRLMQDLVNKDESNIIRLPEQRGERQVQVAERRNRISAVHAFIEFTSADILSHLTPWPDRATEYAAARDLFLSLMAPHVSSVGAGRNDIGDREGMDAASIVRLRAVIEPDHPESPFRPNGRFRNYVLIRFLLDLGLRRGELLGIKVADLDLGAGKTLTIHRRPDDLEDPRAEKPEAKTMARVLALGGRLAEIVHEYIVHHRSAFPRARKHPYLFINTVDGAPLSLSSVNKILQALRRSVPGLPDDLAPHLLRHSWNDAFSDHADRQGVSPENEVKWRARLMGWRDEASARHYLRRTVRTRSNAVLEEMHHRLILGTEKECD